MVMNPEDSGPDHEEFVELAQFKIDPRSVRLLKYEYCHEHGAVVLGVVDPRGQDPVTVGMLEPSRRSLVAELESSLRRPVRPVRLNGYEIRKALDEGYGLANADRSRGTLDLRPVRGFSFDRDDDVPELLDEVLGRAVQLGASDIHIETYEEDVDVRYRIDGLLQQVATPL